MVLFWLVVIILVVIVIRQLVRRGMGSAPSETLKRDPVQILRERYAKGEIDTEEFEERMKTLGKKDKQGQNSA